MDTIDEILDETETTRQARVEKARSEYTMLLQKQVRGEWGEADKAALVAAMGDLDLDGEAVRGDRDAVREAARLEALIATRDEVNAVREKAHQELKAFLATLQDQTIKHTQLQGAYRRALSDAAKIKNAVRALTSLKNTHRRAFGLAEPERTRMMTVYGGEDKNFIGPRPMSGVRTFEIPDTD